MMYIDEDVSSHGLRLADSLISLRQSRRLCPPRAPNRVYNSRMASNVLLREIRVQPREQCPSIVALPRVLDGAVEHDPASLPALEFPGCVPIRMTSEDLAVFEERLELWDARTETAWVVREPAGPAHEHPGHKLPMLLQVIASVRGSPVECYGAMQLLLRDGEGDPRRTMHPDQSVYLRPHRAALPGIDAMAVGGHDLPDVVLEVDNTTDVRRGKLLQYEAWGFPELWVEVPDSASRSRPRRLVPGLTIYVLRKGGYEIVRESRAFSGWAAVEIHQAMNETGLSAHACAVLERVGTAMGTQEGTGPDDDPLLRSQRRKGYNIGHAQGHAEGHAKGHIEGRAALACGLLRSRGIEVSAGFADTLREEPAFAGSSDAGMAAAAMASESEADFLRRIHQ